MHINDFQLAGATDQWGSKHIQIAYHDIRTWIQISEAAEPKAVLRALANQGVLVPGQITSKLFQQMCGVDHFPITEFVDRPGWHEEIYVIGDGTQIAPDDREPLPMTMIPHPSKWGCQGSLAGWRRHVARPLVGQHYPMFNFMLAFAATLRRIVPLENNIGVEGVTVEPGDGKSAVAKLTAGIMGGPDQNCPTRYIESWHGTVVGIGRLVDDHTDALLILDELNAFSGGASSADKRKAYQEIVFQLGGGLGKAKDGAVRVKHRRFLYLSTSNSTLAEELGEKSGKANAAADRLITLQANQRVGHGVFSSLPAGYANHSEFVVHLLDQARKHHGHPFRVFISRLVQEAAADADGLKSRLEGWMGEFRSKVAATKSGSEYRQLAFFALVYAAGKLAQQYGVLPRNWRCGSAVETIFLGYRRERLLSEGRPLERFLAYASSPDVIDLRNEYRKVSVDEFKASAGMWLRSSGNVEFWVDPSEFERRLTGARELLRNLDGLGLIVRDGLALTTKRRAQGTEYGRVACIRLKPGTPVRKSGSDVA